MSMIGNLDKLEVLSFAFSNIVELPTQVTKLKKLRLLDVSGCKNLHVIAPCFLSQLSSLEELYMRGTGLHLENGSPGIFSDIASLSTLSVIDIEIPAEVLPLMDSLFAKLKKFKISVNTSGNGGKDEYLFQNYLYLECDSGVLLQEGIKLLLPEATRIDLTINGLKNLVPLNGSKTLPFSKLKSLSLESCNELVYLVNMKSNILDQNNVFQGLVSLQLKKLPHLERILQLWNPNQSIIAPFHNLKVLDIYKCSKLEYVFTLSAARGLGRLEQIKVEECEMLKVVFGKGKYGDSKIELSNLKYISLNCLPNLVGFNSAEDEITFPRLEELELYDLLLVTSIIHPETETSDRSAISSTHPLFNRKGSHTMNKLQKLISLKVHSCESLRHLWTRSELIFLRELQRLEVANCRSFQAKLKKLEKNKMKEKRV